MDMMEQLSRIGIVPVIAINDAADAVPGKKRGKNSELSRKGGKIRMQIKQKQKPVFSENVKSECLRCAKLDTCSVRNVKWN